MASAAPKQADRTAEAEAIRILDSHRIMALATNRPDGWPQNTIVGYANLGLAIYFVVFRSSQKLANIQADHRVAVAVGQEPDGLNALQAVYAGADAAEVTEEAERTQVWKLLSERHPNLAGLDLPDPENAAVMCAKCKYVSVLDYRIRFGHSTAFEV